MKTDFLSRNLKILLQLVRSMVAERYKQLAREEKLSRFSSRIIDPALLLDLNLQVEREGIHLAELSLLQLVTEERLRAELRRSAMRIQKTFDAIYRNENDDEDFKLFSSENLVQARVRCLYARVQLYNSFLTVAEEVDSPLRLCQRAFVQSDRFVKKLQPVFEMDRLYAEELVRSFPEMQRFMVKKQSDSELDKQEGLWREFQTEVFKRPPALP